ncbi:N-6 DNA methylase [Adhaeretor mobilis]|uniref:site-specific DNA-methyltransferase (adenine-specific) n=1 Tax=Adhaeretor mobilis TaxID=1930276 RepID=A0A517MWQ6_9BACT|nr:N-6 DNA methylase [Adhaeretor mobilis]QDS99314.1 N-6 DNA Methylase [Adhaeretor mobilis]
MKEQFALAASKDVLDHLDAAAAQAGLSRGQAFEDFLTFVRCSLSGQTMEEEYLQTVAKGYAKGKEGERGIDLVGKAFGSLVMAMEETGQDVLGDIFTGGITYGERGQFFTPDAICELMVEMTTGHDGEEPRSVNDPACGSGRFLLSVGKKHPNWEFVGQDVDHRCAQMTAINLGLNGLKGWAVWQNTLTFECHRTYRIGFNLSGGVIREVPVEDSPFGKASSKSDINFIGEDIAAPAVLELLKPPKPDAETGTQLDMF